MARPPLLGKEGKAPRLSTSRFIHVFSPCSKNSLVLIFLLQASRDRSGNPVFDHFRRRKSFVSDDEFLKIGLSGSISRDRSGNPVFDHFRPRKSFVSDDEFLKIGLSGSISSRKAAIDVSPRRTKV